MALQSSIKWQVLYLYPTSFQPSILPSWHQQHQNTTTMVFPSVVYFQLFMRALWTNFVYTCLYKQTPKSESLPTSPNFQTPFEENRRLRTRSVKIPGILNQKEQAILKCISTKQIRLKRGVTIKNQPKKNTPVSTKFPSWTKKTALQCANSSVKFSNLVANASTCFNNSAWKLACRKDGMA